MIFRTNGKLNIEASTVLVAPTAVKVNAVLIKDVGVGKATAVGQLSMISNVMVSMPCVSIRPVEGR